jgi:cyclin C
VTELSVDMEKTLEIVRVILKLYEQWKNFDERKVMATILSKMPNQSHLQTEAP